MSTTATARRPPFVSLRLTSPPMRHPAVEWVQALINERSPRYVVPPLEVDGVFGPRTGAEVEELLYRLGAPEYRPALTPDELRTLWHWSQGARLPDAWRTARLRRMAIGFKRGWGISVASWIALHPGSAPYSAARACDLAIGWSRARWREDPPGGNRVPPMQQLARDLQVRGQFAEMGYAWCALAYYLAGLAAGSKTARMGLVDGIFWPLYTPYILDHARKGQHGHRLVSAAQARKGDGVLFDFGSPAPVQHIGRLIEPPGQRVVTVDGNTSLSSEDNGGAVMVRDRPSSTVVAYFRDA